MVSYRYVMLASTALKNTVNGNWSSSLSSDCVEIVLEIIKIVYTVKMKYYHYAVVLVEVYTEESFRLTQNADGVHLPSFRLQP